MKYLYPYECEKKNLSTPAELQAAIDGNRREGRRSSYGQYEAMHNQMPLVSDALEIWDRLAKNKRRKKKHLIRGKLILALRV